MAATGAAAEWFPFLMMVNDTAPRQILPGNFMYLAASRDVVTMDLSTGAVARESPDYGGLVTNHGVADGNLFGIIGYGTCGARAVDPATS